MTWEQLDYQLSHREIDANREQCSVCGESYFRWELRAEGRCPTCDIRHSMPDPPRPPPLAEVININTKRKREG
jgi:hypothetical protein